MTSVCVLLSVTCAEIAEDSSIMAVGFADATVKVWSLMPQKLRVMKSAEVLQEIDIEAGESQYMEVLP